MKNICFYMLATMILFLTNYSYSLDFFTLNKAKYEIDEIDIGRRIGCEPGFMTTTVIRDTSSQKEIWSEMTDEQAKEIWIQKGKCWPSISTSDFNHLWNRGKFVDFIVSSQNCGMHCIRTVTIYRFDGNKVTKIEQFAPERLKIDTDKDQIVAVYGISEGQCNLCPKRWKRVVYKWDGNNYEIIKSEESKKASQTSPW